MKKMRSEIEAKTNLYNLVYDYVYGVNIRNSGKSEIEMRRRKEKE